MKLKLLNDKVFKNILIITTSIVLLIGVAFFITLILESTSSISKFGFKFFTSTDWDPVFEKFGALPFIVGTLLTSFLSLLIAFPFTFAIMVVLGEYFTKGFISEVLRYLTELISSIPSVVIGLWGLFFLVPAVRFFQITFGLQPYGVGIFTASLLLAFMIIPYAASIAKDAMRLVPKDLKEAAYSLGATRWEVIKQVMIPYSRSGIVAGILLALGRALGETMTVTMVIGNSHFIPKNLFSPGNTIASVIANEFTEATGDLYLSSLIYLALVLFLITALINLLGKYILKKIQINH